MTTNPYDQIVDYLFLGNRHALEYANQFSLIVNCSREQDVAFPPNHTNCIRISIEDSSDEANKLLLLILETNILENIHQNIVNKNAFSTLLGRNAEVLCHSCVLFIKIS